LIGSVSGSPPDDVPKQEEAWAEESNEYVAENVAEKLL
jgi:hypothetical protein